MRLLLVSIAVVAAACASLDPVRPTPTVITNYKMGIVQSAGIGDPIIDVQSARKVPEFVALRQHDPGRIQLRHLLTVEQGQRFRAVGKLKSGDYVIRNRSDTLAPALVVTPDGRALGFYDGRDGATGGKWPTDPLFAGAEGLEGQENAFRAQMIYSGLDGNTVRASYREFSGDFIRPAFAQELQYNLAQDSTIAYKSIKIQVLAATNSQLRFRVLEDGGLPWLPGGGGVQTR